MYVTKTLSGHHTQILNNTYLTETLSGHHAGLTTTRHGNTQDTMSLDKVSQTHSTSGHTTTRRGHTLRTPRFWTTCHRYTLSTSGQTTTRH